MAIGSNSFGDSEGDITFNNLDDFSASQSNIEVKTFSVSFLLNLISF